jgi:cellulose synthase (UDP-forming)
VSAPARVVALPIFALWVLSIMATALIAATPTSNSGQALLGIVAVALVAVLKPFADRMVPRFLMLATASLIVMRYWAWRLLETIPEPALSASFLCAVILFAVETYSILVFFLNAFITADPTARPFPPKVSPEDLPTVDILVPSYDEPAEMLVVTLSAAKNMIYPADRRRVVLCDDGGTDQRCGSDDPALAKRSRERRATLEALCRELGVEYRTRERNEHAKAGNLSAALRTLSGELVVVFDADHVPSRDFLLRTVGYFRADPKLFLVQTPHFFINKDPIERNLGLSPRCPPENEMFYGRIHSGLDRWEGAFFCGSAAVLRRSALDSVGGFAGETITEDAETALEIHSNGWRSLYVDRAMIAGLQPETFASFVQQRGRWATGMIQMLMLKRPLYRRGLSLAQRLCYVNSMSFWLFPVMRLVYLLAPLTYLFFGLEIFVATWQGAVAYVLSYLAVSFLTQNALYARHRWPLISEVYEIAQAPYLARAIVATVLRPRVATFKVTAKNETLDEAFLSPIYRPLAGLFLLTAAGVVALGVRWAMLPGDRSVLAVVGAWAVVNFLMVGLSLRAVCETRQRREAPRVPLHTPAVISAGDGDGACAAPATILDASTSGARIELDAAQAWRLGGVRTPEPGDMVRIAPDFPDAAHLQRPILCRVRSVVQKPGGAVVGVAFEPAQSLEIRETIAYLVFGESSKWLRMRRDATARKGLIAGLAYVLWLSLSTLPSTLLFVLTRRTEVAGARPQDASEDADASMRAFGVDLALFEADREADSKQAQASAAEPVAQPAS